MENAFVKKQKHSCVELKSIFEHKQSDEEEQESSKSLEDAYSSDCTNVPGRVSCNHCHSTEGNDTLK